ncbi:Peroxidase [Gracilaria domingensis]|nr:Peroxidase [Gracilaria domingensis]
MSIKLWPAPLHVGIHPALEWQKLNGRSALCGERALVHRSFPSISAPFLKMAFYFLLVATVLASLATAQPSFSNARGRGAAFLRPLPPRVGPRRTLADPECTGLIFRTLTGRCTSRIDPTLGEARRAQFSYFNVNSAEFDDEGLQSPREVSNIVIEQEGETFNSRGLNEMFTFFGAFLDHDFAFTPVTADEQVNIEVPEDDPILTSSFLSFFRSERAAISDTSIIERPITLTSSALDLSMVYGNDEERNAFIRVEGDCRLKTQGDNLLPFNTLGFVNAPNTSPGFFIAGDPRVNETPMIAVMHTIWVREHNNICDLLETDLERLGVSDPETLYELARAVTIAEFQKIIFEEWLPAILGSEVTPYRGYKPEVDPTVSVEFTTAGFRFGHTLVGTGVSRISAQGQVSTFPAEQMFFMPSTEFTSEKLDEFIRGAAATLAQEFDEKVVDILRNFLFENVPDQDGFDLIALNLQRSRDHNIARFNDIRELFLGGRASTFEDISTSAAESLRQAYGDVDNVEAWVGFVAEDKASGSGVGPTLGALLRTEFERLRDGDQFFYLRVGQFPLNVRTTFPRINVDVFSRRPLFNTILLRTTGVSALNLSPAENAFLI